ncbi:hypothetical protein ACF3DV_11735 [Chlorogloeopsis fritschii PCC 9212]|nr:hypothetical protein [Chlorogloeopsis fritschii]
MRSAEYEKQVALEGFCLWQRLIAFWSDRIHQRLGEKLKSFSS